VASTVLRLEILASGAKIEAGVTFDNSFFDNSFDLVRQFYHFVQCQTNINSRMNLKDAIN
jgi:hypothetical protein